MAANASADRQTDNVGDQHEHEASHSEQSITISDPVKVTISVVKAAGDGKTEGETFVAAAREKLNDLVQSTIADTSSSERSITINDPVSVTITVVQASSDEKAGRQTLASALTNESTEDASQVEQSTFASNAATESSTTDQSTVKDVDNGKSQATVTEEKPRDESDINAVNQTQVTSVETTVEENKAASVSDGQVTTTTTTTVSSIETKSDETPALATSVPVTEHATTNEDTTDEKKESPPAVASVAPTTDENQKSEATFVTVTSTDEKQEATPSAVNSVPAVEERVTTTTTTTDASAETKSEAVPALATSAPVTEHATTSDARTTDDKWEAAPPTANSTPAVETKEQTTIESVTATNDEDLKKEEATLSSSAPSEYKEDQSKKDENSQQTSAPASATADFPIVKGNAQHLTAFQRKKAEYFFNANLDIEDKKFLTWEDVEFYLLFHVTTAAKEGADGGELEARLSRATRALWEHVLDQVPSSDEKREKITLEQFLDTWASLIDYIVKNGSLPTLAQDLVNLGVELYSTKSTDGKPTAIAPAAFEQLFQKMNLGRPHAFMAYKLLSEDGTKPLDTDKINSIVRAVITSSDEGHPSHFLLPGFVKTITNRVEEKPATSESTPPTDQGQVADRVQPGAHDNQTEAPTPSAESEQASVPLNSEQQKALGERLDNDIRNLLRFYRIDDGDFVEVADGPLKRFVIVHPERPLPAYIQQDKALLRQLQDSTQVPQASLEERVSSGEATVAPTVPVREEQESTGIRQVFPPAAEAQLQAHPSSTAGPTEQQQRTEEDEEKIVEHILKQLTPLVEELVTMEVRRARLGRTDQDDDNEGGQDFRQFQQGANTDAGLMSIPPEVLMNMMFANGNPMMAGPPPRY